MESNVVLAIKVLCDGQTFPGWLLCRRIFPLDALLISVVEIDLLNLPLLVGHRVASILRLDHGAFEPGLNSLGQSAELAGVVA